MRKNGGGRRGSGKELFDEPATALFIQLAAVPGNVHGEAHGSAAADVPGRRGTLIYEFRNLVLPPVLPLDSERGYSAVLVHA